MSHPSWLRIQCLDFAIVLIIPVQLVIKCVGSQGTGGLWEDLGSDLWVWMCVCVRVRVYVCVCVCPCVPAAFVFLSQFSIPALRGECFLWVPLLFFNIYLTFCLSSDYWNDCKLVWNNRLLQSFVSEKIWWRVSKILYYKWFSFYFCTYVLCTAVNCIPEMVIKDVL